ncbi:hypothetical protein M9458_037911 [Cirrhinus mrigala]|uniref:Uncharacterized protein n=1 Tax=Cirrhinus mrigala TaxID=683832 RepID=A0ABD0NW49_CIRMR
MAAKNNAEETVKNGQGSDDNDNMTTTEYCKRLQQWIWVFMSAPLIPPPHFATPADIAAWYNQMSNPPSSRPAATATSSTAERGPAQPAGSCQSNALRRRSNKFNKC